MKSRITVEMRTWGPLLLILGLALVIRIAYLPAIGFGSDMRDHGSYMETIHQVGLLHFYNYFHQRLYPPIAVTTLALVGELHVHQLLGQPQLASFILGVLSRPDFNPLTDPSLLVLIKIPPLLAELLIIAAAYVWLRTRPVLRWIIPGLLAIAPGLIADSFWWGQYDALTMLFLVLALIALNRDRPLIAWGFFALSLLTKQQAIVLTPLILVLTFRRYGARRLLQCVVLCAGLGLVVLAPFIAGSGLHDALRPYLEAADPLVATTNSALNLWYLHLLLYTGAPLPYNWVSGTGLANWQVAFAGLTYNQIGYGVFAVYVLLITGAAWRRATEKLEFVWAAALYMAVFMLPTAIHERYLYPCAVLVVLGIAQDWRLWLTAIGVNFTFSYNLAQVAEPIPWPGRQLLWITSWQPEIALLNVILLLELTRITLTRPLSSLRSNRMLLNFNRAAAIIVLSSMVIIGVPEVLTNSATAQWLSNHVAGYSRLVIERNAREIKSIADGFGQPATWDWHFIPSISAVPFGSLLSNTAHYLILDERAHPGVSFDDVIEDTQAQGGMLLWQSSQVSGLAPRQAVFWTFRPQHVLNLTFDQTLTLVGYSVLRDQQGEVGLLMHWYVQHPARVDYHLFMHLIDPKTGQLLDQADTILGQGTHPTSVWRPNEIVFESDYLPIKGTTVNDLCHIRLGLYDLSSGVRALITDEQGKSVGDGIEIVLPCAQPLI